MRRAQFDALLRRAGLLSGRTDFVVIGSQSVHAITESAPEEVVLSRECDLLLDEEDGATALLREQLGPQSPFREESGFYLDAVSPGFPLLAPGWEERLTRFQAGDVVARCLEVHDLVVAKLAAGRLKDFEFVAALAIKGLIDLSTVRARIGLVEELRWRAILLARLQIAVESTGSTGHG